MHSHQANCYLVFFKGNELKNKVACQKRLCLQWVNISAYNHRLMNNFVSSTYLLLYTSIIKIAPHWDGCHKMLYVELLWIFSCDQTSSICIWLLNPFLDGGLEFVNTVRITYKLLTDYVCIVDNEIAVMWLNSNSPSKKQLSDKFAFLFTLTSKLYCNLHNNKPVLWINLTSTKICVVTWFDVYLSL